MTLLLSESQGKYLEVVLHLRVSCNNDIPAHWYSVKLNDLDLGSFVCNELANTMKHDCGGGLI